METSLILIAIGLTTLAGLSTGIGGAITCIIKKPDRRFFSFALGISAGFMLYISFVELFLDSLEVIGHALTALAFFVGVIVMALIDFAIPEVEDPHAYEFIEKSENDKSVLKTGRLTALGIAIHNFPEGIAVLATTLFDIRLGVIIAIGIAMHNIPEGISVSVPFLYSTKSKLKAFSYSLLSGLSEPLGAIVGLLILMPLITEPFLAGTLGFVAGIMVYISLDELLPLAHNYGESHIVILGVFLGMFIMAASLLIV